MTITKNKGHGEVKLREISQKKLLPTKNLFVLDEKIILSL